MLLKLHDWDRIWHLASGNEAAHVPGTPLREAHDILNALRMLGRNPRNISLFRSALARDHGTAAASTDARVLSEIELRLKTRRWVLVAGAVRQIKSGAASKSKEEEWVAEDDGGTTSNDQGLSITPEAEIEEPLSLEFEVEEEPPFSMEIEDETPVPEETDSVPQDETQTPEPATEDAD
jgi:hypothetical protein